VPRPRLGAVVGDLQARAIIAWASPRLVEGGLARPAPAPVARSRLRVLQPLRDPLLPLVEERQHPPEDEPVQQVQDQQEVDDLEGELEDVDPEGVEECHGGCGPR
jgi:hypothetical protein